MHSRAQTVQENQTCISSDINLTQGSAPNGNMQSPNTYGLFISNSTPTSCGGTATAWKICYYSSTTDVPSTAQFGVYRQLQPFSTIYTLVHGSAINFTNSVRSAAPGYVCVYVTISEDQHYAVLPGDVLAACVQTTTQYSSGGPGRLGVVGSVAGPDLSVLQASTTCNALVDTVDTSLSSTIRGYIIHSSLGNCSNAPYMYEFLLLNFDSSCQCVYL